MKAAPKASNKSASRKAKADDTRSRLIVAATELFSERGYRDTTVQEIAKRATVAKATFFVHFATKDAIAVEIVGFMIGIAQAERERLLQENAPLIDLIPGPLYALARHAARTASLNAALFIASLENADVGGRTDKIWVQLGDEITKDIRTAQKLGILSRETPAAVISQALTGAYLGAVVPFTTRRGKTPLNKMLVPVIDAILNGFRVK